METNDSRRGRSALDLVLLVAGVVLIVLGVTAMDSFGSDVSRFFTGSPTDKSIWMLIGGLVCAGLGLRGVSRRAT